MQKPLEYVRDLAEKKGLDAVWKWAMEPEGPHGKAKRFAVCVLYAREQRQKAKRAGHDGEMATWKKRADQYDHERDKFEKRYESRKDLDWPKAGKFSELLYHDPPHCHVASADREFLIAIAKIAHEKFECRIGEFPPFDTVEAVHVSGSWHYRDSSSPYTPRDFSNRGDGLAFDANDLDGGSDQEYALYIELRRRYPVG